MGHLEALVLPRDDRETPLYMQGQKAGLFSSVNSLLHLVQ